MKQNQELRAEPSESTDTEVMLRSSGIVKWYIRHLCRSCEHRKSKCHHLKTCTRFSSLTEIPVSDVSRIAKGGIPTSDEIRKLVKAFNWDLCFLFGVNPRVYENRYDAVCKSDPAAGTSRGRHAFKRLFERCLEIKYLDRETKQGGQK
jgi:hypothetical protein